MNHEEFAFVNHQLAGMLRDGIPLEGSLRQLCSQMQRGQLRSELQLLERDLAKGVPLATALTARKLPELYVQTLQIGARTNDLPAVLTLLADHYQTANATWTRLKGLMVYPVIILVLYTPLSLWIALLLAHFPGSPGPDRPSITSLFGLSTIVSAGPAKPARPRTASSPRNQTATPEPVAHWNPAVRCPTPSHFSRNWNAAPAPAKNSHAGKLAAPKVTPNFPTLPPAAKFFHRCLSGWWRARARIWPPDFNARRRLIKAARRIELNFCCMRRCPRRSFFSGS